MMHKITGYRFIILHKKTLFSIILLSSWKFGKLMFWGTPWYLYCVVITFWRYKHFDEWVSWISFHHTIVPSWVESNFSWVFRGFQMFSRGYFVGSKFFLEVIFLVQNLSSWVFGGSKFFVVGISLAQNVLLWVFHGSKIFSREYFVGNLRIYKWRIK